MLSSSQDLNRLDSPDAEIVSNLRNSVNFSKISIRPKSINDSVDRTKYLSMKECVTCNTSLGKKGAKKFYCHFCYKAVCSACSPLNIHHPESGKEEKTCNPCYVDFLKLIVMETGEEYIKIKLRKEIEEKEKEINERKKLSEELERVKANVETEKIEINKRISVKAEELLEKEKKVQDREAENQKIKDFLEELVKKGKIDKVESFENEKLMKPPERNSSTCLNCIVF